MLFGGVAFAQQHPDDPGIQDSLIIESREVPFGTVNVGLQVWFVTDDSVVYYAMPIHWTAPQGGIHLQLPHFYYNQLAQWEVHYDTNMTSLNYIRMIGFANITDSLNPPANTNGQRVHMISFRCVIDAGTPSQVVTFDTCWDDRTRSVSFGLSDGLREFPPAIVRGVLTILPEGVDDGDKLPTEFGLAQNYPNPFNPETNIDFQLPKESDVSLVVYNLLGQTVKTLVNGRVAAGEHTARWDGRDQNGSQVPSGVYFYKLTTSEFTQTYKMTMLR
jgi:hypothetical protein